MKISPSWNESQMSSLSNLLRHLATHLGKLPGTRSNYHKLRTIEIGKDQNVSKCGVYSTPSRTTTISLFGNHSIFRVASIGLHPFWNEMFKHKANNLATCCRKQIHFTFREFEQTHVVNMVVHNHSIRSTNVSMHTHTNT